VRYAGPGATLDDLREAVTTLEDAERIAHPTTKGIENELRAARAARRARENAATLDPADSYHRSQRRRARRVPEGTNTVL
jgi:hypothetical protein